jgi:hypothetical protein
MARDSDVAGMTSSIRLALAATSLAALAACTKVQEQPVLQAPPPAPAAVAPAPKPADKPARKRWGFDPPAPPARKPPPAAVVDPNSLNGDPNGLKRDDLQKALDGAMPRFTACFDATPGSVNVSLSFDADPEGKAANVKVSGGGASADKCVATVVNGLRLPAFSGKAVPVHFPITIQRTVSKPSTTAASGGPAQQMPRGRIPGGPAMLFVQP